MNDINVEIKRGTSGTQCSLADVRTRTGFGGGPISFGDLRGGEGGTITQGSYNFKGIVSKGYGILQSGSSVSPAEEDGRMKFAANSYLMSVISSSLGNTASLVLGANTTGGGGGDAVTAGYRVTNVNRVAIGGVARAVSNAVSNATTSSVTLDVVMGDSGTVDFFIRFA